MIVRVRWFLVGLAVAISGSVLAQSAVPSLPGGTLGAPTSITPAFSGANNPTFTGQWTVNGSLCGTGQLLQGGSPTTCTSNPTIAGTTYGFQSALNGLALGSGDTRLLASDGGAYFIESPGVIKFNSADFQLTNGGTPMVILKLPTTTGQLPVTNGAGTTGVGLDVATDNVLKCLTRAFGAGCTVQAQTISATTKVQPGSFAFASIGTTLTTNGDMAYCSDCTISNPCAGSGTGAIAKRLNGIFVCN